MPMKDEFESRPLTKPRLPESVTSKLSPPEVSQKLKK